MSFSNEWDTVYANKLQMSSWPWSDLVSLFHRHTSKTVKPKNVLELGCGAGANIRFFDELGINYFGIDGSEITIKSLQKNFKNISQNFACADFTKSLYFSGKFDLIIDRAAITHNSTLSIVNTLKLIHNALNDDGLFISIDWFSEKHSDLSSLSSECVDENTRTKFSAGQFKDVGHVHFSDLEHLRFLFKDFKILAIEEKIVFDRLNTVGNCFSSFNLVCKKM